jgi:hypothetical protein
MSLSTPAAAINVRLIDRGAGLTSDVRVLFKSAGAPPHARLQCRRMWHLADVSRTFSSCGDSLWLSGEAGDPPLRSEVPDE